MPTRRCVVCHQPAQIDDLDLSCAACLEKELDLLMNVYEYLHEQGSGYCPENTLCKDVGSPQKGLHVQTFIKNWIRKGWLSQNELQSVKVPESIEEELQKHGYDHRAAVIRDVLNERKAEGPRKERKLQMERNEQDSTGRRYRMVFAEKNQF